MASWPGVTSPGMGRRRTVTSLNGRASGSGMPGSAWPGAARRADGLAELPANPQRAAAGLPPPLLLGAFDPLLLGWASRAPIVGPHRRIVTAGGLFRPFALAGGRAVATWTIARGQVMLAPFASLDAGPGQPWTPTPPTRHGSSPARTSGRPP